MMLEDKQTISKVSLAEKDSTVTLTNLKGAQELKGIDFNGSARFVCDMNTGICGPAIQEKEGNE